MKIYITGASGFIGKHLVRRLTQTEHEMVCLVRKTSDVSDLEGCGASLVIGDVTDKASLLDGMCGCDWLVNLANLYSLWEADKSLFRKINVSGVRNVMECVLETGISKVVHVSSVTIYGKPADCPFSEDSPVGPMRVSEYARTKYAGDLVAWELFEQRGLPLVVIYPAAVLGPGDDKPSGKYIQLLISGGVPARIIEDAVLTYVHVRDVAEAIVRALEKEDNLGERYLVGGEQLSDGEFIRLICKIAAVPQPRMTLPDWLAEINSALLTVVADLTKRPPLWNLSKDAFQARKQGFICDGSKAKRELGVTYTPVRIALEETIASYLHEAPMSVK
jgi:dihydroflavonol-4-reductase